MNLPTHIWFVQVLFVIRQNYFKTLKNVCTQIWSCITDQLRKEKSFTNQRGVKVGEVSEKWGLAMSVSVQVPSSPSKCRGEVSISWLNHCGTHSIPTKCWKLKIFMLQKVAES